MKTLLLISFLLLRVVSYGQVTHSVKGKSASKGKLTTCKKKKHKPMKGRAIDHKTPNQKLNDSLNDAAVKYKNQRK